MDEEYVPVSDVEINFFKYIQTNLYAGLEDNLKTDKGKSLDIQYKDTRVEQQIYHDLKKHA
jgi:hypothetical protein